MRVAILGHGSMGQRHAANAAAHGCEVGIYDPEGDLTIAASYPAWARLPMAFTSEHALLEWRPDAIVIASPAVDHARQFWRAVQVAPVLVEKPLALSLVDFADPQHADIPLGSRVAMVGYNLRFHIGLQQIAAPLRRIGRVRSAHMWVRCNRDEWPGHSYADTLLECSHELDQARWLLGPARVIAAEAGAAHRVWMIDLQHDAMDCLTRVEIDDRFTGYERGGRVVGTTGDLAWSWHPRGAFTLTASGLTWRQVITETITVEDTYAEEMRHFLRAVQTQHVHPPTWRDGLAVLRLIDDARDLSLLPAARTHVVEEPV